MIAISPSGAWWHWPEGREVPLLVRGSTDDSRLSALSEIVGTITGAREVLADAQEHMPRWEAWLASVEQAQGSFAARSLSKRGELDGPRPTAPRAPLAPSPSPPPAPRAPALRTRAMTDAITIPDTGWSEWLTRTALADLLDTAYSGKTLTKAIQDGAWYGRTIEVREIGTEERQALDLSHNTTKLYRIANSVADAPVAEAAPEPVARVTQELPAVVALETALDGRDVTLDRIADIEAERDEALEALDSQRAEASAKIDALESERDQAREHARSAEDARGEALRERNKAEAERDEARGHLDEALSHRDEAREARDEWEDAATHASADLAKLREQEASEAALTRDTITALERERDELREQIESERAQFQARLDSIIEQGRKATLARFDAEDEEAARPLDTLQTTHWQNLAGQWQAAALKNAAELRAEKAARQADIQLARNGWQIQAPVELSPIEQANAERDEARMQLAALASDRDYAWQQVQASCKEVAALQARISRMTGLDLEAHATALEAELAQERARVDELEAQLHGDTARALKAIEQAVGGRTTIHTEMRVTVANGDQVALAITKAAAGIKRVA